MGLDMYLKRYVEVDDVENQFIMDTSSHVFESTLEKAKAKTPEIMHHLLTKGQSGYYMVGKEVAYWRKANHIHSWFVENVQDGNDDCGKYEVSIEQLTELLGVCKQVMEDREDADELLPTRKGFFFGGTEYDEYYYEDTERTILTLEEIIRVHEPEFFYAYYSSW
jgi:hypothetical protein